MRFRPLRRHAPPDAEKDGPDPRATPSPPPAKHDGEKDATDGPERMTAVEWARRHQLNSVLAERAAMYAGKRNELVTEEEFLEMIRRTDV